MHGIFNRGLQCFVRDIFGLEVWEQVCARAELTFFNFEAMLRYEDGITDQVIMAMGKVLNRPRDELLEDFGTYVVSEAQMTPIRRLLRFGGDTYTEFLHSLEDVHDLAKMAIPDLDVPRLRVISKPDNCFTLYYSFAKRGYGSVFLGMLRGMADDYGALVVIDHKPLDDGDVDKDLFEISVALADHPPTAEIDKPLEQTGDISPAVLAVDMLDILLPLHIQVDTSGKISHIGPMFSRLLQGQKAIGENLTDLLEFRRPHNLSSWQQLHKITGAPITARLRAMPNCNLKAVCVPLAGSDAVLIDFSLGAAVYDIVAAKNLNRSSFSPADPTAVMLYLKEMQFTFLGSSIALNSRLDGAKTTAETQAYTDPLTGLPNRRGLFGFIQRLLDRNTPVNFGVMQIDLDFFKAVNDTHGHAAGDHVLQEVAKVLQSETRSTDMVARIGGDEFVIVLSNCEDQDHQSEVAARIIRRVAEPIRFGQITCRIGASIGAATAAVGDAVSAEALLDRADKALYLSKRNGRGRFNMWDISLAEADSNAA